MPNANRVYYTPEQAEKAIREYSGSGPSADMIRFQAQNDARKLGFPVSVIGSRVYIPVQAFRAFWGLPSEEAQKEKENEA